MKRLPGEPKQLIVILTAACLLLFWITIPIPRIDNQLVGSDGVGYYVYLPSALLDGDLDFTDEYRHFFAYDPDRIDAITNTGQLPANQWPIGPAIFWTPFFLLAHLLAHLFNLFGTAIPTDGYGYFYQAIVLSGNILYGGVGLWLVYRFVREYVTPQAALVSTFLITLTGNLIYYLTAEPSMAHALSLFASGLFFYVWLKRRDQPGLKSAALYGLLGGMMALIRQQDGLFLALPFLAQIPDVWRHLTGRTPGYAWWRWLRDGIVAGVVALLVFSPQLIVWGILYGDFFHSPYLYTAETPFYWFTPKLGAVLFSAYRGLFTWHPIFLLAVAGLFLVYRNDKTMALVGCCGLIIQWYLISAWHVWYQGDAFGGRMFIVATPIFVLGLAYLIEWAVRRWSWQVVYLIGGLLLAWNFLLAVEYRFDLTIANRPPTWYDLTLRRLTFPLELLNRFRS